LENPLVKQAMDLFGAEVRSVLDLRDKKWGLRSKRKSRSLASLRMTRF